jgi:hypothetical protein
MRTFRHEIRMHLREHLVRREAVVANTTFCVSILSNTRQP